ncbi:leucine-rich repeat domain-containing protein [Phormidium sp. CLA17]|uniref:COR domain-containing protein n=1 Tax=Leptolyngbya sp. Cla-17 TaxID=2803751 RepID=UPI00149094F9|nr:COR domain-containing protein [Leptolyngbya sp. Cla-17]MBM0740419.1 leucine-rich repeat domain-containing protein [Leptolyngbya sp. Cla-17]
MTTEEVVKVIQQAAKNGVTRLDLSDRGLTFLPSELWQLTSLQSLNLSRNKLISLPDEISQLISLSRLELSRNKLTSLSRQIGQLTNLISLTLRENRLAILTPELCQLTNLITLDLRGNQLVNLPGEFKQLINLQSLDLSSNQKIVLPDEFEQLTHLRKLSLSSNQLTSFPTEITQLTNLHTLALNGNQLTSLPSIIAKLTNLNVLGLSGNRLTSLPAEIVQLTRLHTLDLNGNRLTSLPAEIVQLTNLSKLYLNSNPLLSLPAEIRRKTGLDILNFYRQQLEQETDRLYEAKLLIIGEGEAGKTTLAKKIQDPNYQLQKDEASTDGIDIIQYRFPLESGREFQVNIWDFGGQQIYHETHQFFLTKRSLYALVADARKEDTDFYYWLNIVELLSDNSPLLIVKNEKQDIKLGINERQLRGEFTNLKETFATNFANNRGLSEILTGIKNYISTLPHVATELPKAWGRVRKSLEQEQRNYISLDEYLQICQDNGFTRRKDKLQLSGYLHDLGVCLHFQKDDLLNKTIILKPTWGTDAVYKVLRNPQVTQNLGKFTREDLAVIWCEDKYATMHPELLRLMMNFKLCYEIPSHPGIYIAPQLLSPEQPEYEWDESENLLLRYEYEFMPKGILTRFIVEMHQWIEHQTYVWKSGVVLSKNDARAEVIEFYRYHKGEIHIRVSGKRPRDLLITIRHELDKIHDSYKYLDDQQNEVQRLKFSPLVPCNCIACKGSQSPHFYPLERLHKFQDDRKDIQCPNSYDMVNVRGLVDDIAPEPYRLTDAQRQRVDSQKDCLQSEWDVRTVKLRRLRQDSAIETETTRKFELEQQIQAEEEALARLTEKLDDIEQQLNG